jgi:periplasmic protein CpxP/Spy
MLFRQMSIIIGLTALTLGNPPVLAQSNTPSSQPLAPQPMMMNEFPEGGGGQAWMDEDQPGGDHDRILEQLNLSDAQKQEIQSIRQRYREQMQPLHEQLRTQQDQLRDLLAGTATDDAIRTQHNQVLETRQKLGNLHFESMLEVRNVLDQNQRNQLAQFMEQHHGQGRRRDGNRNNPQGQGQGQGRRSNRNNQQNNNQL